MTQPRRGFTLLEIIVGSAIVAILVAFITWGFSRSIEKVKLAGCQVNLRTLASGIALYAADNNNEWPYNIANNGGWTWSSNSVRYEGNYQGVGKIYPYLQNQQVFFCPADTVKIKYNERPFEQQGTAYSSYVIRGLGQSYNWTGIIVDNRNALGKQIRDVDNRAIVSCYFLHIPGRDTFPLCMHRDRWPVLYGDGAVALCPIPDHIDPASPPDAWNVTRNQIQIFDSFDR